MEEFTQVFVWGNDSQGQLGLGSKSNREVVLEPKMCSFNILIRDISCGEEHSAFISQSGYVYTVGSNADGRLGIGTKSVTHSNSPCLVEDLARFKVVKISTGNAHTVAITEIGVAYAWGNGESGALGTGSQDHHWSPTAVNLPHKALDVSCGSRHTGFVVDRSLKHNLFMCGAGESGQLGTGGREKSLNPTSVLIEDSVIQVACGTFQTAALTSNGKVFMTGGNNQGQLGIGNKKSRSCFEKVDAIDSLCVTKVFCSNFTAALTDRGGVYVWGTGTWGECLVPHKISAGTQFKQVSLGTAFALLLDVHGNPFSFGNLFEESSADAPRSQPCVVQALQGKNVVKVACGNNFAIALGPDCIGSKQVLRDSRTRVNHSKEIVNKSFEDLKNIHNKSLQNFRAERTKNLKLIENLEVNVKKFKLDVKKIDRDRLQMEKENQELARMVEDLQGENLEITQKLTIYKEKIRSLNKSLEDAQKTVLSEAKKAEVQSFNVQKNLKDLVNVEVLKNQKLSEEVESLKENARKKEIAQKQLIKNHQEIIESFKESLEKAENEKKKILSELESSLLELQNLKVLRKESKKKENDLMTVQITEQKRSLEVMQNEIILVKNDFHMKTHEFSMEKNKLQRDIENLTNENIEKNTEVNRYLRENQNLRAENDLINQKILSLQNSVKENLLLTEELSKKSQTILDLQSKLETSCSKSSSLQRENLLLSQEISVLQKELSDVSTTHSDLFKTNQILLQKTETTLQDQSKIENLESLLKTLELSKQDLEKSHQSELFSLKQSFQQDLQQKITQIQDLELKLSKQVNDSQVLKQTIQDLKQELDEGKENKGHLSIKCERLIKENRDLRAQISESEGKNREIFMNLEKDLAAKAKNYKERTMNLLSGPRSSTQLVNPLVSCENGRRPRSPFVPSESEEGNVSASLLTALDKSPRGSRSTTPTQESVKARISALLRDKTQIESELNKCEY
jgi:X-linked retinitis pigmentosa GTPase regulator